MSLGFFLNLVFSLSTKVFYSWIYLTMFASYGFVDVHVRTKHGHLNTMAIYLLSKQYTCSSLYMVQSQINVISSVIDLRRNLEKGHRATPLNIISVFSFFQYDAFKSDSLQFTRIFN